MSWTNSAQMNLLEHFLNLSATRQALITSNIANVDTPGYHTRDISFKDEMQRALQSASQGDNLETTQPVIHEVHGLITRPDGNNVSIDREGMLLSEVQLQFSIASQLMKAKFKELSLAINEGSSST
jgi:flagellar basal-body rod protein FlgB